MNNYDLNELELLTPNYLDELGLREAPFAPGRDTDVFYFDEGRARHLELIQHLFGHGDLLLVISGPKGSGKTRLLQQLTSRTAPDWRLYTLTADPMFGPQELLIRIAQAFDLDLRGARAGEVRPRLNEHLAALQSEVLPILLVDDAHVLAPDALEALVQLADTIGPAGQLVRTVLFSESESDTLLGGPRLKPLRESVTHKLSMPTLDAVETGRYLEHRLLAAGFEGESPFPPAVVRRICRRANGIPGRINLHAHRWLSDAPAGNAPGDWLPAVPWRAAVGAGALALILAPLWLWLGGDDEPRVRVALPSPLESAATAEAAPEAEQGSAKRPRVDAEPAAPEPQPPEKREAPAAAIADERVATEKVVPDDVAIHTAEAGNAIAQDTPMATAPPGEAVTTRAVRPAAEPRSARFELHDKDWLSDRAPDHYTLQLFASGSEARVRAFLDTHALRGEGAYYRTRDEDRDIYHLVLGDFASRTDAETAVQLLPESLSATQPWVRPFGAIHPQLTEAHAAAPVDVDKPAPAREEAKRIRPSEYDAWLWDQDPRHYTLQLVGSRNEERLKALIREHAALGTLAYFRTRREGEDWFVLVHGVYPDRDRARAAIETLPEALRVAQPWARSFASLHAGVRTGR